MITMEKNWSKENYVSSFSFLPTFVVSECLAGMSSRFAT